MVDKRFACMACLFGFIAVLLGAFGAHGLKGKISPEMMMVFETAVRYQMYHALLLLFISILLSLKNCKSKSIYFSAWAFVAGIVIFSGSLYALVLTGVKTWGAVTPVGGLLFLLGWLALFFGILKRKEN